MIYNDAYLPMLGSKHPRALGQPGLEVWSEIQDVIAAEIVGKPVLEALPELRGQGLDELLRQVVASGQPFFGNEMPIGIREKDGIIRPRFFNLVYSPITNSHGAVDGVSAFAFDVTAGVLARRDLEQASRAKDEFLATMGHELRTPLNAMLGWATMLKQDRRDQAKLERGLAVIERNAQAQTRLVSDLLDVSRIISGKLRLSLKWTQLATVIHAAADVVRPAADAKGVRLIVEVEPNLGPTMGDPDRLQQIVWNLLSNAVRFTPTGGRVMLSAEGNGSNMTVRVQDTGAGIPAAHLPHIFERFRQVDSTTTRAHSGLGLGLAIVRHLAEAHGGGVVADSAGPGLGATFTVTLPIRAVDTSDSNSAEPETEAAEEMGAAETAAEAEAADVGSQEKRLPLRKIRALVVEDDEDSLDLIRVVLEGAGAEVVVARSAQAALERARGKLDVIIGDISMPEMDGYSLMRSLRMLASTAKVPAIALTAYARLEDAERALAAGYQQHISKPVESTALITTVQRVIQEAR
jgi:signal transduction histidine kinase/CheY-like chemotaxis protein